MTVEFFRIKKLFFVKIDSSTLEISTSNTEDILLKVFEYLGTYLQKNKLVVVFDEFQEIENIAEESVGKLRSIIQNHKNICNLFSGSDSRLIDHLVFPRHFLVDSKANPKLELFLFF